MFLSKILQCDLNYEFAFCVLLVDVHFGIIFCMPALGKINVKITICQCNLLYSIIHL